MDLFDELVAHGLTSTTIFIFSLGSDAIRPFITEKPIQIYEKFNINIDSMFGITSHVCTRITEYVADFELIGSNIY